jgi:hypothetical protein
MNAVVVLGACVLAASTILGAVAGTRRPQPSRHVVAASAAMSAIGAAILAGELIGPGLIRNICLALFWGTAVMFLLLEVKLLRMSRSGAP